MRRICLLMLVTFVAPLQRVPGQQAGPRVRITMGPASSQRFVGTLVGQDADSLWVLCAGHAAPLAVARSAVALEVSRGQQRAVGDGALIGAGFGVIGGFVLSGVRASESRSCGTPDLVDVCYVDWYARAFRGGLIGGAIGAALGAALGYAVRTEHWEGVPLSRAHQVVLAPRGPGLALSLMF
ncbi:MAG TPA: hypothetical protein VEU74_05970 [Gemmatimonadales bacterium]|nr:hypothetical protein [Gemmatimonadales bacterium]